MIRFDFVSNSSSTSFMLTINKDYDLNSFCEDAAKTTISPNKQDNRDPNLFDRNLTILKFCLSSYILPFLGYIVKNTTERIQSYEEFLTDRSDVDWQFQLKMIEDCKDPNVERWVKETFGRDYIDDEGKLHHFYDSKFYAPVLTNDQFRVMFCIYSNDNFNNSEYAIEQRHNGFKELLKSKRNVLQPYIDTYQITKHTINNTRFLLSHKDLYDIRVNEDYLDKLEKMLDDGHKILCIHENFSGNGYDAHCIYSERNTKFLKGLNVTILESEYM